MTSSISDDSRGSVNGDGDANRGRPSSRGKRHARHAGGGATGHLIAIAGIRLAVGTALVGAFMCACSFSAHAYAGQHGTSSNPSSGVAVNIRRASDIDAPSSASRDSYRTPIDRNVSWGGLGTMSVPYSQSTDEKSAVSDLKAALKTGHDSYNGSNGKVKDEGTRKSLSDLLTTGDGMTKGVTDDTSIDRAHFGDVTSRILKAVDAVNASVSARNEELAEQAAAAASSGGGYSTTIPVASAPSGEVQSYAKSRFASYGWGDDQWAGLAYVVGRESGWNTGAVNPSSGARGLFQCLGHAACMTPTYMSDYREQVNWGLDYIASRYGTPNAAAAFWKAHSWY